MKFSFVCVCGFVLITAMHQQISRSLFLFRVQFFIRHKADLGDFLFVHCFIKYGQYRIIKVNYS